MCGELYQEDCYTIAGFWSKCCTNPRCFPFVKDTIDQSTVGRIEEVTVIVLRSYQLATTDVEKTGVAVHVDLQW